ncbi:hypothetical protein LXL04_005172 [Taraxacum kok-saghyz]
MPMVDMTTQWAMGKCIAQINENVFHDTKGSNEVSAEETIRDYRFPYATHNPQVKWNVVKPFIGERYESRHQLKLCLTNYSISKGYQIRFKKCDSVRLIAVCASPTGKNNCPFLCRASWMSTEDSFQVKVLNLRHKCVRNYNNSALMNPTWLAKQFMKELIRKPNLKCKEMQAIVQKGWKSGCRRAIGLDGCFLKGQCKGELLTTIGRDANNQIYPIAWAVVEVENKMNWKWFLQLVDRDLQLHGGSGLCVISDQHKGLLEAVKEVLPNVEHRQCARHIYANFRKVYSGLELKKIFWSAAKSTTQGDFKFHMERINTINPDAYAHLMAGDQHHTWCRAFFSTGLACEAVENGVAECFNVILIDARKKPLLTMLEEIRLYMMERFYNLKETASKWEGEVCPAAIQKMESFAEDIRTWVVVTSGVNTYEIRNGFHSYGVNLVEQSCSCRLWELSGIPCVHAQVAILYTNQDPVQFISSWFSKGIYMATYQSNILPVNGTNLWEETEHPKPLPPLARRMPGRPSVKRKRHVSENQDKYSQVSSKGRGRTVTCNNCLQKGHNRASCKNEKVVPAAKPKKKIGRPRLEPDLLNWTGRRGRRGRGGRSGSRGRGGGRGTRGRGGESVPNYTAESDDVSKYAEDEEVFEEENEAANLDEDAEDDLGDEEGYNTTTAEDIKRHIHDLKFSGYTDEEIMETLGLTEEEYNEHVGVKQVPVQLDQDVGNHLDDTQEITVDEVGLDQEGLDDGGGGMDEVGLDQEGLHDGGGIDEIIPEEMIVPIWIPYSIAINSCFCKQLKFSNKQHKHNQNHIKHYFDSSITISIVLLNGYTFSKVSKHSRGMQISIVLQIAIVVVVVNF